VTNERRYNGFVIHLFQRTSGSWRDYPTLAEQDQQRGVGNWDLIHQQAARCVRLGVPVTIIAVMMKSNYFAPGGCRASRKTVPCSLACEPLSGRTVRSVCAHHEEYWQGFKSLFESTDVIALGEPLVRAMGASHHSKEVQPQHSTSYTAGHYAALRVLARFRRAADRTDSGGTRNSELYPLRAGAYTSGSVRALRVQKYMSWGLCGTKAPARVAIAA
jgi:hypothetical protein